MSLSHDTRRPVSVLGLGALGRALATAFLQRGHPTTVWNRTPGRADDLAAAGALPASTATDAVGASDVVVIAVPTYDIVRRVLDPAGQALEGRVVVNLTSGTPDAGRELAGWLDHRGVGYVDGAAMSGTRLVGRPEALFLYGGAPDAFEAAEPVLTALGAARYLGADPGAVSLFDTALLSMNMGVLSGFHHGTALVGAAGVDASAFASVALGYLPFVTGLLDDHARQIDEGRYAGDDGTLTVLAAAMEHVVSTSRHLGVRTEVPDAIGRLLAAGIAAGHGDDGVASLADSMRTAAHEGTIR